MSVATEPKFVSSDSAEFDLIDQIAVRAAALTHGSQDRRQYKFSETKLHHAMNVSACHANGNPLWLADLLAADDFNFAHDVFGIDRHIDRDTGKLLNHFSPRYSARVEAEQSA